jgi:hypothetical protein
MRSSLNAKALRRRGKSAWADSGLTLLNSDPRSLLTFVSNPWRLCAFALKSNLHGYGPGLVPINRLAGFSRTAGDSRWSSLRAPWTTVSH